MKPTGDERTPDGGEIFTRLPAHEQLLSLVTQEHPTSIVLQLDGAVDGLTAPRFRDALREAFGRLSGRVLILDLSAVDFLGSPGLQALADAATQAAHHDSYRTMRVVVDQNRPVLRPIEIVGLDGVLQMYPDLPAAMRDGEIEG